mgnify:CR=1 FL=1
MARKDMDRLVEEALKIANDAWARKGLDKNRQIVTVTRHNITAAFGDAIDDDDNVSVEDDELRDIGNAAFTGLKASLARSRISELSEKLSDSNKVVFTQERYTPTPFRAMKRAGKAKLREILQVKKLDPKLNAAIDLGAQRLHTESSATVGLARLAKVMQVLDRNQFGGASDKFSESQQFKDIFGKFGDILADIEIIRPYKDKPDRIVYKGRVGIEVKRKAKNFPGSEDADWTKIKPALEEAISAYIEREDIEDKKGSKSIKQQALEQARFAVLSKLPQTATIRRPKVKAPKFKDKFGSAERKGKDPKTKSKVVPIPRMKKAKNNAGKSHKASLYTVMAMISEKLPETVRKNMGAPRLENQTGRFASSVKITDVVQTPQGMPSFGYTYRKDPYGVYERSSGTSRADPDRDPRNLIDASIREIAAGYALGRFYTRRV